jgi:glycosyltransferase involved in cell wall biosynthesis
MPGREGYLGNLLNILSYQLDGFDVEVIVQDGEGTIGDKRNSALWKAKGDYVAFIDDDDEVSDDYIEKVLEAIKTEPDCCSLTGQITFNGQGAQTFEHSIKYNSWRTNIDGEPITYERFPNHLNAIKRSIAIQYRYISVSHGEDRWWSEALHNDKVLKTEVTIDGPIYYYKYRSNK